MKPRTLPRGLAHRESMHGWEFLQMGEEHFHVLGRGELFSGSWSRPIHWRLTRESETEEARPLILQSPPEALARLVEEVSALTRQLNALQEKINALHDHIAEIPTVALVTISDLNTDEYVLASPVPITVEEFEQEVVATWTELEVFGSGDTVSEALCRLKGEIVSLYKDLTAADTSTLGRLPRAWLRILSRFIRKADAQSP